MPKLISNRQMILAAAALAIAAPVASARQEVRMPDEAFKQLERFEAHTLEKADKAFRKKDYQRAVAEYDAFVTEFPRSSAVPYALLRKARSLHLLEKRFAAIKIYQQILDFFPNRVHYAAAAQYYIGRCHWQNGDVEAAMKAWAKMADDKEYSKHFLAASAINKLASHLAEQGKKKQAVEYWKQVAVDFRKSNSSAARKAINKVIPYYIRTDPNEPALRKFYKQVGGFRGNPRQVPKDLEENKRYWNRVRHYVKKYGNFKDLKKTRRNEYYRYWAEQLEGRFPAWDDYQIDRINFIRAYEQDTQAWMRRLDKQFKQHQKKGDYDRIVKWIRLYSNHSKKVEEYYKKFDFSEMSNKSIRDLFFVLWDDVKNRELARRTFQKINLSELSDNQLKNWLYRHLRHRSVDLAERVCKQFDDKARGKKLLLDLYWRKKMVEKGVKVADELVAQAPKHAQYAYWRKAELLRHAKRWDKAIQAYRKSQRRPHSLFRIARCHANAGRLEPAIKTLQEIQNFFANKDKHGDAAPKAALRQAHYYRDAGKMNKYVAALRKVLNKYPKSSQSSKAHNELEKMGVERIEGGVDAKK